jgi:hypothetical protein
MKLKRRSALNENDRLAVSKINESIDKFRVFGEGFSKAMEDVVVATQRLKYALLNASIEEKRRFDREPQDQCAENQ